MSKDHGKKCQVKILDRKKFDRMFLTENFLQSARNCLHHISDRYFQQTMNKEIDTLLSLLNDPGRLFIFEKRIPPWLPLLQPGRLFFSRF